MTMFQQTIFGESRAVGMFSNRKAKQADLFGGLSPLKNDPPARLPLSGQTSFLDATPVKTCPVCLHSVPEGSLVENPDTGEVVKIHSGQCYSRWMEAQRKAKAAEVQVATPAPTPKTDTVDVASIIDLFSVAKANGLKYPKIRLEMPGGGPIVLSLVASGHNEGKVRVTNGGSYGQPDNVFYGFVDLSGQFSGRNQYLGVWELLNELAANPAKVAAEYGKGSGECCFCGRPLTNGKAGSVEVGYGPICAEKFGLPWTPNGQEYEMVVGAPVATDDETESTEQLALPAPAPLLALPSPTPTIPDNTIVIQNAVKTPKGHKEALASLKQRQADRKADVESQAVADHKESTRILLASYEADLERLKRLHASILEHHEGPTRTKELHRSRSKMANYNRRIAKLRESL